MKFPLAVLSLLLAPLFCGAVHGQEVPQTPKRVVRLGYINPGKHPALSLTQALAVAERELATRQLISRYYIQIAGLNRAPDREDMYDVILAPIQSAHAETKAPAFGEREPGLPFLKVDMKGNVQFFETSSNRGAGPFPEPPPVSLAQAAKLAEIALAVQGLDGDHFIEQLTLYSRPTIEDSGYGAAVAPTEDTPANDTVSSRAFKISMRGEVTYRENRRTENPNRTKSHEVRVEIPATQGAEQK